MLDKKKAKLRRQQEAATDKRFRYSIRKFNVGVASVAIAAFMFLGGGAVVSADDTAVSEPQTAASSTGDSSSTTSEAPTATSTEATSTASEASTSSESAATSTEATSATSESAATSTEATSTTSEASTSSEAATSESAATSTEATSEATSTTASTASETASNTASTPTTVEEAKTVLEQVISEAEVLAQEASRQAANSTEDATALQTAAEATKLVATEATVTFNNALATFDEVNAQITAVRTNVEALALELRKYFVNGDIVALLDTTTSTDGTTTIDTSNANSVYYAQDGVWDIPDPVKAANSGLPVADQEAVITEGNKNIPDGYIADQDANRDTFLILNLDTVAGDDQGFNDWAGKNYYITFSVSTDKAEREANDVVYAKLVEKTDSGSTVVNTIELKPGEKNNFDELKVLETAARPVTYGFTYTVQTANGGTTRNIALSNSNGNNRNAIVYSKLESSRVGIPFTETTFLVAGSTTQTTSYFVKENAATGRVRELLAKHTQTGGLTGDAFHIAGAIDFDNYELIESELPTVTSGTLASDYVVGTQYVVLRGNWNEARMITITDVDGSIQIQTYMLDPNNPDWATFYKNNMNNATISDFPEYFKLMFTTEVIAPQGYNSKEGTFSSKFYEADKLVLESTEIQVLDANGDVLGTLSDDKTTIKTTSGATISVASTTDTMVTGKDGTIYTVNYNKIYKTDADGNYVDADGNVLTPIIWDYSKPNNEFVPGIYQDGKTGVDGITISTGPLSATEHPEGVLYFGYNYHTSTTETRLTDSETDTRWDVGGLEQTLRNANTKNEQHVRYWYTEKGGVEVYYITEDGTVLTDFTAADGSTVADKNVVVGHGDTDSAYDTTSVRYESITAADGTVYYYKEIDTTAANLHPVVDDTTDTDYRANEKIDAETGTIKTDTVKQLTYVYEKAGSVNVNYVDTDGNPLQAPVADVTNGQPGSDYDTADNKPETITAADGTVYFLAPAADYAVGTVSDDNNLTAAGNGTATGVDTTTGTVESGATKEITYVYQKGGDVIVHYVDENGNPISGLTDAGTQTDSTVTDTAYTKAGTGYDTTDLKPNTITTADGKIYQLVPAATQGDETGEVVAGETQEITYVYKLVEGDVIVHYVDTEGNTISSDVTDTPTSDTGTDYNTTDNKPEKIVNDETGDVYYYKEVKAGDNETGKVVEGTTEVTYIYEKAGSVNVNYVDTDGNPLIAPVADVTDGKPGSDYDTLVDNKPETIATADGKLYRLVPAGTYNVGTVSDDNNLTAAGNGTATGVDSVTGTVEAGTTKEITYVYEEVKGDVVVEYYDTDGNVIATTVVDTPTSSTGTPYNTLDQKPATITTADGTVYYYKEVKSTSAAEDGTVVEGTTTVQYVYEKAGSVNVNYVDTDGNPIQAPVADETNEKAGTEYTTADNKPTTITTADGKTYKLVPAGTYNVGTVSDDNNLTSVGNGTATGVDSTTGTVEAGTTKEITYVYEEVKGNVVVNYITTDGTVIKQPVEDTPSTSTGTPYDTTDHKPTTITTEDGKTYRIVPTLTQGNETGDVVEGTTSITYVYEEVKGDVVVEYYDTEGNLISGLSDSGEAVDTKEVDTPSTSTGTAYNTDEDHKPNTITTADGTVYYYKEVKDTSASTTGEVVEGTTTVQYVYEKAGNVIVHYITEDGTVIKATVTDEENAEPGKSYTTTDNKPTEIVTEDGSRYVLIPSKTIGTEDGSVEAGKTIEITYVYKKVANWVPQIPATPENPTPVNPVIPYPFDPTNPDKPIDPTTPYPGGEVPSIPHVPGYTPVDPKTNEPLKPVDPTDPNKGYVPPTPDESGIDTPIPYVQNGNVVVNYVTEDGTVIKASVQDETDAPAGKSYDTTDNKPNTITTEDGTTYELVRVEGSETGTVEGGKTTEVTYVYRKVETPAKKVVTNHVDEDGNPIAPQEEGTTPNKSIPGYEFTGKTITDENGNTTHIYRKVVTPVDPTDPVTPEDPTDPVTPVTPVDPKAPVQPGVPVKPETPAKPGAPAKPEAPAKPTYVAETLPNTGEDNSASVAAMGASMILASLGLAAKRRRKED
ncbi:MucBP domain-containing protein [Streptococcus porcorum]|uniref:LPXTG-motif cell wall-anchored protein n=1 Tax=Streptococcus porcorum TaxID=701526 RepID=A0ABV2JFF4_9STRE